MMGMAGKAKSFTLSEGSFAWTDARSDVRFFGSSFSSTRSIVPLMLNEKKIDEQARASIHLTCVRLSSCGIEPVLHEQNFD